MWLICYNCNNFVTKIQLFTIMKTLVSTIIAFLASLTAASQPVVRETIVPSLIDLQEAYVELDTVAADKTVHNSFIMTHTGKPDIYSMPYSTTARYENWGRLGGNTALLFAGGFTTLAILQVLPEDATAWNKDEIRSVPLFTRWVRNVKKGPVIDKDNPIFNYILHPYAGAAYYMSARSEGFNMLGSFLYSAFISTVLWEYGIEAFMEIPSLQDLLITPICGAVLGEGFYRAKRAIVDRGYYVLGSKTVGYILAFLCDPVNEFLGYFRGNPAHDYAIDKSQTTVAYTPWFGKSIYGNEYGISVRYVF